MINLGPFLQSMVSPQTAPGSSYRGAANSLGDFGKAMAEKKHQQQYYELQKRQWEEPQRQAALDALKAALGNPDDPVALKEAIADAKRWGVSVDGIEGVMPEPKQEAPAATETSPEDKAASDQSLGEFAAAAEKGGKEVAADSGEPTAPVKPSPVPGWLKKSNESLGTDKPPVAELGPPISSEADLIDREDNPPQPTNPQDESLRVRPSPARAGVQGASVSPGTEAVASALPDPPPVQPKGAMRLGSPETLVPKKGGGVTISIDGKPYATFDVGELKDYRSKQSALVAHVFQPLIDNSADDQDKRAAEIAQKTAVEAYNSGMSKAQAIEYGNRLWASIAGQRFKRDYTKFPPGWKPAIPGGGGAVMSDKQAVGVWDKLNDNEKGWVTEARQQFATAGAQKALSDMNIVSSAARSDQPLVQNQGIIRILHEISGAAVTDPEAARFYAGLGLQTKAEELARRIIGGDQSPEVRRGVQEIASIISRAAQQRITQAGEFVYNYKINDYRSPESDEERGYRARFLRSLFTGEAVEPMTRDKKGNLRPMQGGGGAKAGAGKDDAAAKGLLE